MAAVKTFFNRSRPPGDPTVAAPGSRYPRFGSPWLVLIAAAVVIYLGYFWFERRVVVGADDVLVLMRKHGTRSVAGDQVIIPNAATYPGGADAWKKEFGDANGILEGVYLTGTYFGFSPFDYERQVVPVVTVPSDKVGIVIRKFGAPLSANQVLADPSRGQRGPLPGYLQPGRYPEYSNPYAFEVKLVNPVVINPGQRGVVTLMAGRPATDPNQYLVSAGEQGVQRTPEPEGYKYINPFERRVTPVFVTSQRFEMGGQDAIRFPSSDSFEIKMEGFVEWSIDPDMLPQAYVAYSEGGELIPFMEEKVILPYARSYSRLVGSRYTARQFISGDTKLQFQKEFSENLMRKCGEQGIRIHQALVRDIVPPDAIRNPINEREIARQQIKTLEERIKVARSQAELATQEQMADQNQKIGEANKAVVTVVKQAEQARDVAVTKAQQELAVAKLRLEAAQKQADALVARGKADADVVLFKRSAEAEPLRQQVAAFGDGNAYARYFFYQKVAPSMKSILTNTDGPFADVFKQYLSNAQSPPVKATGEREKVTEVRP